MRLILEDAEVAASALTVVIGGKEFPLHVETPGTLTLSPDQVKALVTRLGGLPFRTGQDLVDRVAVLAGLTFHRIDLDFSSGQLAELQHQAERRGITVEQHARDVVNKMRAEFFNRASGDSIVSTTAAAPKKKAS